MTPIRTLIALASFVVAMTAPAAAGPPLICHSIDIGTSRSLPWLSDGSWNGAVASYDVTHLIDDTLGILTPSAAVNLRMEALRRAAIYSARERGLADALTVRLLVRALDAAASGRREPGVWFDAGYFVETLRQAARIYPMLHGCQRDAWMIRSETAPIDGLAWIQMAVRLGASDMQPAVTYVEASRL